MGKLKKGFDILCLCHLRWDEKLFQRPQQIMRRLSKNRRVVYVSNCSTKESLRRLMKKDWGFFFGRPNANLLYINIPFIPFLRYIPFAPQLNIMHLMFWIRRFTRDFDLSNRCLWLYHPNLQFFTHRWKHQFCVYDCMDHFPGFENTDSLILKNENHMLDLADIVFTGGRSLQKSKEGINPRTHCFPSGVEYAHFHLAASPETEIAEDIKKIKSPILGYFGAVDERVDYLLLQYICEKRPDYQVVLIGPLICLDFVPVDMPNFHYLGPKNYEDLPGYLKAFDIAIMPFVDSVLTRHISPTKTPEYLAGNTPVLSTPVPDVITDYSDLVLISHNYEEFVEMADRILNEPIVVDEKEVWEKIESGSWENIASDMEQLILEV